MSSKNDPTAQALNEMKTAAKQARLGRGDTPLASALLTLISKDSKREDDDEASE